MSDDAKPTVQVFQSDRMSDPSDPSDTMEGKRFRGASGEPMSIIDILRANGVIEKETDEGRDQPGESSQDAAGVRGDPEG